jgi:hypothetical protein
MKNYQALSLPLLTSASRETSGLIILHIVLNLIQYVIVGHLLIVQVLNFGNSLTLIVIDMIYFANIFPLSVKDVTTMLAPLHTHI